MSDKPTIDCRPDGPYLVKGLENLANSRGEAVPTQDSMALCRCGGSANKPFCDGTHRKIGFSGSRAGGGPADRRESYRGRKITIHDNRSICAHAGYCTDQLAKVFKYGEEPWVDPDGADADAIVVAIRKCPSGALSYSIEGKETASPPRKASITIAKDGPYQVVGARLDGQTWGEGASPEHYTLCRCGASKNKPFCDGSHWNAGFKDDKN